MVVSETVEINIERRNITFYRKLGYELKVGTKLVIPVNQLMIGAKNKIKIFCDICNIHFYVVYKDYLNSNKNHNFDVCNKCKFEKIKITNNKKYGCDSPLQNNKILQKFIETNNKKYGGNSSSNSQKVLDKQRKTRIKNKIEIPSDIPIGEFKKYRNRVDTFTNKNKKELFNSWNGYDFYDGEYIKDNLKLHFNGKNYPTIEHKTSVFYGFMNKISEEEISKLENLAITKKSINSSRGNKNFDLFRESFNKII